MKFKKKFFIKGSYQITGSEEKEFEKEFEIGYENSSEKEEANNKLSLLLDHPLRLIKEGGKLGVTGVRHFFTVFFLFTISNTILLIYSIVRLFETGFEFNKLPAVFLILILGLATTIYALHRTYQYVTIDTLRVIYENLAPLFKKIAELIIDKTESILKGKTEITDKQISNALDFGKIINSKYKKMPWLLRKGIILVLNRIPFVGMLIELKSDLVSGNKSKASAELYSKMDGFISKSIFSNNNTKWVWWLLPANILVLFFLIKLRFG